MLLSKTTGTAFLVFCAVMTLFFASGCSDSVEKIGITGTSSSAVVINEQTCIWCGLCYSLCPSGAISEKVLANSDYAYIIDPQKCVRCGVCISKCPVGAISWKR
jgi:ferredoxin